MRIKTRTTVKNIDTILILLYEKIIFKYYPNIFRWKASEEEKERRAIK